jgi:hypothetical protein
VNKGKKITKNEEEKMGLDKKGRSKVNKGDYKDTGGG